MRAAGKTVVTLIADDAQSARGVIAVLEAAMFEVRVADESALSLDGLFVLLDNARLPSALYRLITLMPGRAVFPNVVLVIDDPSAAGGLLAEGFRDIVVSADVALAVECIASGRPPIYMQRLRDVIEREFLAGFSRDLHGRARRAEQLLQACVDLVRACQIIERKRHRLQKQLYRHYVDEFLVAHGRSEHYVMRFDDRSSRGGVIGLPKPPALLAELPPLGEKAPRLGQKVWLDEILTGLQQMGLLGSLAPAEQERLVQVSDQSRRTPLAGLEAMLEVLRAAVARKQREFAATDLALDAAKMLADTELAPRGFGLLEPGFVLPRYIILIIESLAQPPTEVYLAWTINLRTLGFQLCSEVLGEMTRALATSPAA